MNTNVSKIKDFDAFFLASNRIRGRFMNITWKKVPGIGMEIAFIASKASVAKQAHLRNRAKRRLRAAFNEAYKQIGHNEGLFQIAFIAQRNTLRGNWSDLFQELSQHIKSIIKEL